MNLKAGRIFVFDTRYDKGPGTPRTRLITTLSLSSSSLSKEPDVMVSVIHLMPECQKQIPLVWFNWSLSALSLGRDIFYISLKSNIDCRVHQSQFKLRMDWMRAGVIDEKWKWLRIVNCVSGWLQPTEYLGPSPEQTNVCHFKQWVSSRGISLPSQKFTKTLGLLFVYDKSPISGLYLAVVSHASVTISESHVSQDSDIWHHLTSWHSPLSHGSIHILESIKLNQPWHEWGQHLKSCSMRCLIYERERQHNLLLFFNKQKLFLFLRRIS